MPDHSPQVSAEDFEKAVEAGARAAFFEDDLGGHVKGKWTYDTISEEGRENYRKMVRAVLAATESTPNAASQSVYPPKNDPNGPGSGCSGGSDLPHLRTEQGEAEWRDLALKNNRLHRALLADYVELRGVLQRLQLGPDTLTPDGLRIVLNALYPPCTRDSEGEQGG